MASRPPRRIRFRSGSRPFLAVGRVLVLLGVALAFVPGVWIVVGAFVVGPDRSVAIIGALFLAGAAFLAWVWLRAYAFEVAVEGGEIRWRGYFRRGAAPLSDLRRVAWGGLTGAVLSFRFQGGGGFDLLPGRGVQQLLTRLGKLNPGTVIRFPRLARLYVSWLSGAYEEIA